MPVMNGTKNLVEKKNGKIEKVVDILYRISYITNIRNEENSTRQ